jgi:hypothetical protein
VAYAHYGFHVLTAVSFLQLKTSSLKPLTLFMLLVFACAVAGSYVMGAALPLKGPVIPFLFTYVGVMFSAPSFLAHSVEQQKWGQKMSHFQVELLLPVFSVAFE